MKEIENNWAWKIKDNLILKIWEQGNVLVSKNAGMYRSEKTMGDRVLFQVFNNPLTDRDPKPLGKKEALATFGPVIYGHWIGSEAPTACKDLKKRMQDRSRDVEYTSARLVQIITAGSKGNTGFGIWNADKLLTKEDSHGDAGVILVDVSEEEMRFICMGGYLEVGKNGIPKKKEKEAETDCEYCNPTEERRI